MQQSPSGSTAASTYKKPKWGNLAEFILSCMSMCVGLGNFWRFPYICYENGGGAFLLPYLFVLLFLGRPMYYLDMAMGQFSGRASIYMYYKLMPGLIGIGVTQMFCCMMVISYYAYISSIVIFYLVHSFQSPLPWDKCEPTWGNSCISGVESRQNRTDLISSAQFFLEKVVLMRAESVDDGLGWPSWKLCGCLSVIWIIAFLNIIFGIKSFGKVVYFTALFPYVILITLLIKSATLPGATDGMLFFVKPVWSKLLYPQVWLAAITQCFFSLNVGCGTIAMYSSYNDVHTNLSMISAVICAVDTLTSFTCGLTIFSALGNLAKRLDVKIDDVYQGSSMGLGFVSYPDAISTFGTAPYVFAVFFFLMFFTLGLGGLCAYLQLITTNILEVFKGTKAWQIAALTCTYGYIAGIIYTTPGGGIVFDIVDNYGNCYALTAIALLQAITMVYVYGLHKWCWNMEYMLRDKVNFYWRMSWGISCPVLLLTVYIYSSMHIKPLMYSHKPVPVLAQVAAYVLITIVVCPIILCIFIMYCKIRRHTDTKKEAWVENFSSKYWMHDDPGVAEKSQAFIEKKQQVYRYKDSNRCKKIMCSIFAKLD